MNQFTYLTTHSLLFLLKPSQKLVSDNVLLLQHVVFLFEVEVGLQSLVEMLSCHLLLLSFELIPLRFDALKLLEEQRFIVLELAGLVCILALGLD